MGYEQAVLSTLPKNIYNTLFTLLNANKPTGWVVLSSFPEKSPTFPCIVLNSAQPAFRTLGQKRSIKQIPVQVKIELFSDRADRMETMDTGKANIANTLLTNFDTLRQYGLVLEQGTDAIAYSETTQLLFDDTGLNVCEINVSFKVI